MNPMIRLLLAITLLWSWLGPATAGEEVEASDMVRGGMLAIQMIDQGLKPAQDVSFRLQRGHIHALIGPNGAGKSTMINMLTGVIEPDAGSIRFLGRNIVGQPAHAICCMAWAEPSRTCACSRISRCSTTSCSGATAA